MPIDLICHHTLHKGMELLKRIVSCRRKKKKTTEHNSTVILCKQSEKLKRKTKIRIAVFVYQHSSSSSLNVLHVSRLNHKLLKIKLHWKLNFPSSVIYMHLESAKKAVYKNRVVFTPTVCGGWEVSLHDHYLSRSLISSCKLHKKCYRFQVNTMKQFPCWAVLECIHKLWFFKRNSQLQNCCASEAFFPSALVTALEYTLVSNGNPFNVLWGLLHVMV